MLKRLAVLALLALTACGALREGASCQNASVCEDSTTALLCEDGALHAYKCRGPSGCASTRTSAVCDYSGSVEGEACPRIIESKALCDTHNANGELRCTNGVWTAQVCNGCLVQDGMLVCKN